ncbi:hypothetical protein Tco_1303602 [Tanacetum coccineum]
MTSFDYRLNPIYAIKECSSCGSLYTSNCGCSKGSLEDKILVPKPPRNCVRCARCGTPVDGPYCQGCALLRKEFMEGLFTNCVENEFFKDFQDTSESSNDNTNVVNAPREPIVVNQNPGKKSSPSPLHIDHCCHECGDSLDGIFCRQCTCKSCGKGAHYGYNCPSNAPIISNPEPCNTQTIDEPLQNLQSLQQQCLLGTCQRCGCNEYDGVCFYCKVGNGTQINVSIPYSSNDSPRMQTILSQPQYLPYSRSYVGTISLRHTNEEEEKRIAEEQAAKDRSWKIPLLPIDMKTIPLQSTTRFTNQEPDNALSKGTSILTHIRKRNRTNFNLEEISSGSPTTHSELSLPDYKAFYIDNDHFKEKSSGSTTTHIEPTGRFGIPIDHRIRKNVSTTNVNVPLEDDQSSLFTLCCKDPFFAFLTYPWSLPYLLPPGMKKPFLIPSSQIIIRLCRDDFPDCEDSQVSTRVSHLQLHFGNPHCVRTRQYLSMGDFGTDNQEKDEKQSQNDKTGLGMEETAKDKAKSKPESQSSQKVNRKVNGIMETEAIDNKGQLVNYDNENENEIDDLGYQSEEYIEDAHEDDENNHSYGYAKRGTPGYASFAGNMENPVE